MRNQTRDSRTPGRLRRFLRSTKAVSALEYAVLVAIVVVGTGAALLTFGNNINVALEKIGNQVSKSVNSLLPPPPPF